MSQVNNKDELCKFAKKCAYVGNKLILDTEPLTPINYHGEKEKFFKSSTYNPIYKYKKKNLNRIKKLLNKLNYELISLTLPTDLNIYLKKYLQNLNLLFLGFQSIGTPNFAKITNQLFDWSTKNINNIKTQLPQIRFQEECNGVLSAKEIKKELEKYIKKYGIYDHPVITDNYNDHTIRVTQKKVIIGYKVKRNFANVKRLIVHEIETHVIQKYNVRLSKNPLLKLLIYKDWWLYAEGLAVYNEIQSNTLTHSAYDTYLYRVEAVKMLNQSFRQIYNNLATHLPKEKAFITTYRVKRGLADTSAPGGFPKDAAYLLGYKTIVEYVQSGGKINTLYVFRIPQLAHLLTKYNLWQKKKYKYPKFLK